MLRKIVLASAVTVASAHAFASDVFLTKNTEQCANTNPQPDGFRPVEIATYVKLASLSPSNMSNTTRIFYGKASDQFGDLRLPKGKGPFPLAVVVHGGAWNATVNLDYFSTVAVALTKAGFATWSIEYSRLGSGGEWPASFKAVGAGADYARVLAKQYPIDLNRVITIGHSAGGSYALWLAGRHNIKPDAVTYTADPLKLRGVIALDGDPDLAAFAALPRGKSVIANLLGAPQVSDWQSHLTETSPLDLLPLGVPQYHLTENSDRLPSIINFMSKSKADGDQVDYDVVCPANHMTTSDATVPVVRDAIVKAARQMISPHD
jgi:acetyl esterase/lipase